MKTPKLPQSVAKHLIQLNPKLWQISDDLDWTTLGDALHIVVGSSFVDPANPYGPMGNPFAVVIGKDVAGLDSQQRLKIAQQTNTPETVFINECRQQGAHDYLVSLTVYTPSGSEMGACAHGFFGALKTLLQTDSIIPASTLHIVTTVNTSALAAIDAEGNMSLEFQAEAPRQLSINDGILAEIYGMSLGKLKNHGVLSVGSPKLIIEVTPEIFDSLVKNLSGMSYRSLLEFQDSNNVNGIHVFCRNSQTRLPEKCIQNNAYSGPDNLADRATGVSNAAQISADESVAVGQALQVTQYSYAGPSAILTLTKLDKGRVMVGGMAALFNVDRV